MLLDLHTGRNDNIDGYEEKKEKQDNKADRLDGWVLSPHQRCFLESLFDEHD
ncbi:hypothetical protein [Pantoea piersonii]|jgi:hypothetical protein|uniref:hypothetical protein n=1 Tax=Pantoea piersonii TaxID=2364647 RepID=UPI001314C858|nr:hypothetical protein [Pantoea piersonii]MBZ6386777.1 hypothetical protein [Pantoea piersonii]MBZ6400074.1 hypothetical protein [Pantoea piersonii]MBZ6410076.1 hypothetical protein [Pantoea piersonii]MBZ6426125.1 hypothetical protein [Pantoea piersonii]NYB04650.1 hypothetical protein [Pantoea piersonii]